MALLKSSVFDTFVLVVINIDAASNSGFIYSDAKVVVTTKGDGVRLPQPPRWLMTPV